jgi:hypothetical protein
LYRLYRVVRNKALGLAKTIGGEERMAPPAACRTRQKPFAGTSMAFYVNGSVLISALFLDFGTVRT